MQRLCVRYTRQIGRSAGSFGSGIPRSRGITPRRPDLPDVTTDDTSENDLDRAVDQFLDRTDTALSEYDQGYVDADATLSVIRTHVDDLREAAHEE